MGEVYRARDHLTGRVCAVKRLRSDMFGDTHLAARFQREADAITRVRHPNIVEVWDAGVDTNGPYIVMEYLHGETVAARLGREGRLSLRTTTRILEQVLGALGAAHDAGVIHRDVKPANVFLVSSEGELKVKLLDFGIAKLLYSHSGGPATETGRVLGTPDYLSPEHLQGDREIDHRADLFSVGSVLYELLTGSPPFRSTNVAATTYAIVHKPFPPPLLDESLTRAISPVLERALAKDPALRFQSAAQFWAAFSGVHELGLGEIDRATPIPDTICSPPPASPDTDTLVSPTPAKSTGETPGRVRGGARVVRPPSQSGPIPKPHSSQVPRTPSTSLHTVSGRVLNAVDRAITIRYGQDVRDSALARLPAQLRARWRERQLVADEFYDARAFDLFARGTDDALMTPDTGRWKELGRASVEIELVTVLRRALLAPTARDVLTTAAEVWSSLFNSLSFDVGPSEDELAVLLQGSATLAAPLRAWVVGMVEQTTRAAGYPRARAEVLEDSTATAVCLRITLG
jgi:serine/threonine-protein kinase